MALEKLFSLEKMMMYVTTSSSRHESKTFQHKHDLNLTACRRSPDNHHALVKHSLLYCILLQRAWQIKTPVYINIICLQFFFAIRSKNSSKRFYVVRYLGKIIEKPTQVFISQVLRCNASVIWEFMKCMMLKVDL